MTSDRVVSAGIRKARLSDVDAVQSLLQPLEKEGVLVKRSRNELEAMMHDFIVIERETRWGDVGKVWEYVPAGGGREVTGAAAGMKCWQGHRHIRC